MKKERKLKFKKTGIFAFAYSINFIKSGYENAVWGFCLFDKLMYSNIGGFEILK